MIACIKKFKFEFHTFKKGPNFFSMKNLFLKKKNDKEKKIPRKRKKFLNHSSPVMKRDVRCLSPILSFFLWIIQKILILYIENIRRSTNIFVKFGNLVFFIIYFKKLSPMLSSAQYPQRFLDLYNLAKDLSKHHHISLEKVFDNILEVENPQLTVMGIRGALDKKGFLLNKQENQPLSKQEEQQQMTAFYQKYQNKQRVLRNKVVNLDQRDMADEILVSLEQMQQGLELNYLKNIHELEGRLKKEFQQGKQEGVEIQHFIEFQEIVEKKFTTLEQKNKPIQNTIEEMAQRIEDLEHRLKEEERKNKRGQQRYDELSERFNEFQESFASQNSQWESRFKQMQELILKKKPHVLVKKAKKKRSRSHSSSSSSADSSTEYLEKEIV